MYESGIRSWRRSGERHSAACSTYTGDGGWGWRTNAGGSTTFISCYRMYRRIVNVTARYNTVRLLCARTLQYAYSTDAYGVSVCGLLRYCVCILCVSKLYVYVCVG